MKMVHPDSGQVIEVSADRAAIYESQGWERTPAVKTRPVSAGGVRKNKPAIAGNVKEQANG